ncbi:hypothetical protein SEMRO_1070_G237760.1 [Seminavis robusta]|uniref:Uncharacterized protein n=1 Tax=Seminavis robusta TaxID=568900 RepID=A0A9N8EKC8_9STRA|nr:hypothetical protein SEMRO_1070_G237760.1 [Seminavis robusta]|eukprot:Sro1070_g237760.1 n/a (176) ;mRNA; r:20621-21148
MATNLFGLAAPGATWQTYSAIHPVANLDQMGSPDKFPVVLWRTSSEGEWEMKATEVLFQRLDGTSKFRFMVKGYRREGDSMNRFEEHIPVSLTKRVRWNDPKITTLRGRTSKSRLVEVDFHYDIEDRQPNDIIRVEVIIPKTADSDNGKVLYKALNWARSVVAAQLDFEEYMAVV